MPRWGTGGKGSKLADGRFGKQTLCQLSYSRSGGQHSTGACIGAQNTDTVPLMIVVSNLVSSPGGGGQYLSAARS
jgi:hypothetical protein